MGYSPYQLVSRNSEPSTVGYGRYHQSKAGSFCRDLGSSNHKDRFNVSSNASVRSLYTLEPEGHGDVVQMIFLFNWVIFRLYVNFHGCKLTGILVSELATFVYHPDQPRYPCSGELQLPKINRNPANTPRGIQCFCIHIFACVCVRVVNVCKYVHEYLKTDVQICIHSSTYTIYLSIYIYIYKHIIYIYIYMYICKNLLNI